MQRKLKLAVIALCYAPLAFAQTPSGEKQTTKPIDESAFTFTEAQLGDDDDMTQNISILNSNSNLYASGVGYLFSPVRFRYRALNQSYNEIYINGAPVNDMESGQFRYSQIGGLNQQTKNVDFALPFEDCQFGMPSMAGSNNYDFRSGNMAAGHRATVSAANRNYNFRGMYNYNSGFNKNGWAVSASLTYRWAKRGYVEGTFYNALSYFFGVQKLLGDNHSLSFATWGNPTERGAQGCATDEVYWLTDNRYYNSYWGYQNGHVRNSRVVTAYSPSAVLTWDWDINKDMKLTTTVFGRYGMYKSTRLNYNNADNPHPDYWKNLPSSYFYVWGDDPLYSAYRTESAANNWKQAYDSWQNPINQQINWNQLYYANSQVSKNGADALYFIQAKNIDNATHSHWLLLWLPSRARTLRGTWDWYSRPTTVTTTRPWKTCWVPSHTIISTPMLWASMLPALTRLSTTSTAPVPTTWAVWCTMATSSVTTTTSSYTRPTSGPTTRSL